MTSSLHELTSAEPIAFPDPVREFIDAPRHATISTIDPDGMPRHAVVWYTLEGDEIVINSRVGRRWPTNLLRDPRIAFSVVDAEDGGRWVGITGSVESVRDQATAQADIAGMARRYHADKPWRADRVITKEFELQERISFRFRATSLHVHFDE